MTNAKLQLSTTHLSTINHRITNTQLRFQINMYLYLIRSYINDNTTI